MKKLLTLALLLLTACGAPEPTPAPTPEADATAVRVRTVRPDVEDVEDVASLPGDLLPDRRATLAAEVPGTVESVTVDLGDRVERGQLLVKIDTRALEQAAAEAESVFRQTQAQLERARNLFDKRSITKKDLLDAVTNHEVAQARLASAELELEKSSVAAPWSGRVTRKHVEVGDYAAPGMPLIELVDIDPLRVRALASASDAPLLEVGSRALVRVDALPERTLEGRVTRMGAELDPAARTLDVEVEIDNPDGLLKPGMLARVEIPRRTVQDALLIPLEAVVDLGDRRVVYVVEDGKARRREVELGSVLGRRVVVASGLDPSARVIVEGTQEVSDGQRVEDAAPAMEDGSS